MLSSCRSRLSSTTETAIHHIDNYFPDWTAFVTLKYGHRSASSRLWSFHAFKKFAWTVSTKPINPRLSTVWTKLTVYVIAREGRNLRLCFSSCLLSNSDGSYEIITVIVTFLTPNPYLHFVVSSVSGGFQEILGKELSCFVKVVTGPLESINHVIVLFSGYLRKRT